MTGGLGINRDVWEGLTNDLREVLADLGEKYTVAHAEEVMVRYVAFLAELPASEIEAWITGLPNLASDWVDANADRGAQEVLNTYMAKVQASDLSPPIDRSSR